MVDIRVPTLGESVSEATVGKWFKQPGDAVAVDEPLVELETDKVTLEVPAPAAGILSDVAAKNGDTVGVGALLGAIKEGAGAAPEGTVEADRVARGAEVLRRGESTVVVAVLPGEVRAAAAAAATAQLVLVGTP